MAQTTARSQGRTSVLIEFAGDRPAAWAIPATRLDRQRKLRRSAGREKPAHRRSCAARKTPPGRGRHVGRQKEQHRQTAPKGKGSRRPGTRAAPAKARRRRARRQQPSRARATRKRNEEAAGRSERSNGTNNGNRPARKRRPPATKRGGTENLGGGAQTTNGSIHTIRATDNNPSGRWYDGNSRKNGCQGNKARRARTGEGDNGSARKHAQHGM